MRLPVMRGLIDRRILVNFRIDPEVLATILPSPFRPKLFKKKGIAGICLIRLKQIRPRFVPGFLGFTSENAAHRIAVEWDEKGQKKEGVYIPRRDTSSRLNSLVGGRLFSGVHHHARFQVQEKVEEFSIQMDSDDGETHVAVAGRLTREMPADSIFSCIDEASQFFESGSLGYSATNKPGTFDGLELSTLNWEVLPFNVEHVASSFFHDQKLFPAGSVEFDCGLLMRNIKHEWQERPALCVNALPATA